MDGLAGDHSEGEAAGREEMERRGGRCRVCGCTDEQACVRRSAAVAGEIDLSADTCDWTEPDLCSACTADGPKPDWIHPDEQEGVEILAPDPHGEPLSPDEFAAALDGTLERWNPDGDELDDLEQLMDRDEQVHPGGAGGLFSADGRQALRAAIARRRA